ncbi:LytR/AlgR family response regulator transcription factor [Acetonema longum]|uniref:Two-component response regulator n=1 Tax=Acetonema longum DSM 6540 TaxID=1009370 RepID=F7NKT6_9FIRM|nr:LytTR family DNA-binding domain-containing protein [Acetonema longum]EGO63390.1 two-component response regulator [Acetonema longum DSM 6540]
MKIGTIIVDDEPPIGDEIEFLLKTEADITVVGKYTNSLEAWEAIRENSCDLVFLDINMPGLTGLDLAQKLSYQPHPPFVVFITAFPEHALEAFNTPAVGYITKPVTSASLTRTLGKIRTLAKRTINLEKPLPSKICVLQNGKIIPLNRQDIVFVYVKDKDVFVRTQAGEYATSLAMQEVEQLLGGQNFLRVHRQYLVNLDQVGEIIPWFHGSYLLRMKDSGSQEVPVSRNKIKELKSMMGLK